MYDDPNVCNYCHCEGCSPDCKGPTEDQWRQCDWCGYEYGVLDCGGKCPPCNEAATTEV